MALTKVQEEQIEKSSGDATGDYVVLEDVGGSPGLPAVDGSQLTGVLSETGTDIGDVVELEDVGGSAGLPAVDGSQLTGVSGGDMDVLEDDPAPTLGGPLECENYPIRMNTGGGQRDVLGINTSPGFTNLSGATVNLLPANLYGTILLGDMLFIDGLDLKVGEDNLCSIGETSFALKDIHANQMTLGGVSITAWPTGGAGTGAFIDATTYAYYGGPVHCNGTGAPGSNEGLRVTDDIYCDSDALIDGDLDIGNDLAVTADATVGGALGVTGRISSEIPEIKIGIIGDSLSDPNTGVGTWVRQFKMWAEQAGVKLVIANASVGGSTFWRANGWVNHPDSEQVPQSLPTYNLGWDDSLPTPAHTKTQVETIIDFKPDLVFIMLGFNDVFTDEDAEGDIYTQVLAMKNALIAGGIPAANQVYCSEISYSTYPTAPSSLLNSQVIPWNQQVQTVYSLSNAIWNQNGFINSPINSPMSTLYTTWYAVDQYCDTLFDHTILVDVYGVYKLGLSMDGIHATSFGNELIAMPVINWMCEYISDNYGVHPMTQSRNMGEFDLIGAMNSADIYQEYFGNHEDSELFFRKNNWFYTKSGVKFHITPQVHTGVSNVTYRIKGANPGAIVYIGWEVTTQNGTPGSPGTGDIATLQLYPKTTDANGDFEATVDASIFVGYFTGSVDGIPHVATIAVEASNLDGDPRYDIYDQNVTVYG